MLLVRLETDQGITGWGEAFGHAVSPATRTVLDTLVGPMLIGRDPRDIDALMVDLQRTLHLLGRNGPVMYALSGVDIALWDIAGKAAGPAALPIARRHRAHVALTVYSSLLRCTGPAGRGGKLPRGRRAGLPPHQAARDHACRPCRRRGRRSGRTSHLMLDTNCPWSRDEARAMVEALRPHDLYWLEEPLWPPEDYAGLAQLRATGAKIAAGENANLTDFRPMFELGAVDFAQPSVAKIGGVSEMRRIIALAHDFGIEVVPHCGYLGAGFLATVHIAASMGDVLVERLGIDLEASPFGPWAEIDERCRARAARAGPRLRSRSGADRALSHARSPMSFDRGRNVRRARSQGCDPRTDGGLRAGARRLPLRRRRGLLRARTASGPPTMARRAGRPRSKPSSAASCR